MKNLCVRLNWRKLCCAMCVMMAFLSGCGKVREVEATLTPSQTFIPPITSTPMVVNMSPTLPPIVTMVMPTSTPMPTATAICNLALFVADVTYPDRTQVVAGTRIEKTWRLKNVGVCGWNQGYKLALVEGDLMSVAETQITNGVILPGMEVDITVPMNVPATKGLYKATYMIKTDQGIYFGAGSRGEEGIWVILDVLEPTVAATYTVTQTATTGTETVTVTATETPVVFTETPVPTDTEVAP